MLTRECFSWSLLLSTIVVLMLHSPQFAPFVVLVLPGIFNGFSPHAIQFGCHSVGRQSIASIWRRAARLVPLTMFVCVMVVKSMR